MNKNEIIDDICKNVIPTWSEEDKTYFFLTEWNDRSLVMFHHSFGRWIRNHYRLWDNDWKPEIKDGVDYSPNHPDAISMDIITEVWKRGLTCS